MLLFLAALCGLLACASAQPPLGCTPLTDPNPYCLAQVCVDATCFGQYLFMSITDMSSTSGSAVSQPIGGTNGCYQYRVSRSQTMVSVTFNEGTTQFTTLLPAPVNAEANLGLNQTITNHIATFTINLQNYDPAGVSSQLPSFAGNTWGVKLYTLDNQNPPKKQVFREYRDVPNANYPCSFNNTLPLSALTKGVALPTSNAFQVCVLPWNGIYARVSEVINTVCPSEDGAVWVDCHRVNNVQYGRDFDPDCTKDANNKTVCNSGLCVTRLEIPAICDWMSTVPQYKGTRYGLTTGSGGLSMTIRWQPLFASEVTTYRVVPNLPWGAYYEATVLAVDNYATNASFPAGSSTPVTLSTRVTDCANTIQCEMLPLSSLLQLDIGVNNASVSVTQGPQTIVTIPSVNNSPIMCVLNYLACPTVTYQGPVAVTTPGCIQCEVTNQYCLGTPYYVPFTPDWDCWIAENIDINQNSFPSHLLVSVVNNDGAINFQRDIFEFPTIRGDWWTNWQVPNVPTLSFNLSEGSCTGLPSNNFQTCVTFSTPIDVTRQIVGTNGGLYNTLSVGRVLVAFELFYLDSGAITVDFTDTSYQIWRTSYDQGGTPRCYCVLPLVLRVAISESASCWKSSDVNCVLDDEIADISQDCEVCDFLSILRFDLRGLPAATSATLRAGPQDARQDLIIWQRFENSPPYNGSRLYEGTWTPNPVFNAQGANGVSPAFPPPSSSNTGNSARLVTATGNTLTLTFSLAKTAPAKDYTTAIDLSFWAYPLGYTVVVPPSPSPTVGGTVVVTGSKTGLILQARVIDTANGVWTLNSRNGLVVTPGETITVVFQGLGVNPNLTPLIDEVKVTAYSKPVDWVRDLTWVGDIYNNITVLRNGFQECYQQYCLEVNDNGAALELCTICSGKECEFKAFTRVLCLNMSNPWCVSHQQACSYGLFKRNSARGFDPDLTGDDVQFTTYDFCGYGIDKRLKVEIFLPNTTVPVRTINNQGGVDGSTARLGYRPFNKRAITTTQEHALEERAGKVSYFHPIPTPAVSYWQGNGWYTVLRLEYDVKISEFSVAVQRHLDCRDFEGSVPAPGSNGCCISAGLVTSLTVNTVCNGVGNDGHLYGSNSGQWYTNTTYMQRGTDIILRDANGVQFRGQRGKIFYANCSVSRWDWSSATCRDCGYRSNCFGVLQSDYRVSVWELPYKGRPMMYPDTTPYPKVTVQADCTNGPCATILGQIYSYLQVRSERGWPSRECLMLPPMTGTCTGQPFGSPLVSPGYFPYVGVKFGYQIQTLIRSIPEELLWEGCYTKVDKRMPIPVDCHDQINRICVIADPTPQYAIQWGSYASLGSGGTYADCSSLTDAIDNCRNPDVIVVPNTHLKRAEKQ